MIIGEILAIVELVLVITKMTIKIYLDLKNKKGLLQSVWPS